jgi:hypothetical protein
MAAMKVNMNHRKLPLIDEGCDRAGDDGQVGLSDTR